MFGTDLRNPLYWVFPGAHAIAFTLAAAALGIGIYLLWSGKATPARFAFGGGVVMLAIGADLTRVFNTDPVSVTVHPDASTLSLNERDDYFALLWAHPSDLTVVASLGVVGLLGWLVYRSARGKLLLTMATTVTGLFAASAVFLSVSAHEFQVGATGYNGFGIAENAAWDLLAVALVVLILLAAVVGVVRGVSRFKQRAQLKVITGGDMVAEPSPRVTPTNG